MSRHAFDDAIALTAQSDGTWLGHTSPAYGNMVGPFGGVTAAQAMNAVLQHPQRLGDPVSLTVNFAAALADGPFTVQARPARTNRSTQHWMIEVLQQDQTVLTATAFTALRRDTWSADEHTMPVVPRPLDVPSPARAGRVEWINRYEMRFVDGDFPAAWDGRDQGISQSCSDNYGAELECQWVDITDVPPGSYVMRATVNGSRKIVERDYDNNHVDVNLEISDDEVLVER